MDDEPRRSADMTLIAERLDHVDGRLAVLEDLARKSNELLGTLVTLEERRVGIDEKRYAMEEEEVKALRKERAESSSWARGMVERLVWPALAALGLGGSVYGWVGGRGFEYPDHPDQRPHMPPHDVMKDRPEP